MSRNGKDDMFWKQPWDLPGQMAACQAQYGVSPRPRWMATAFGGRKALETATRIIFSNGEYDPWAGGGVLTNVTDSIHAVFIAGGAHHLDFMWSTEKDPESVIFARQQEKAIISEWIRPAEKKREEKDF